MAKKACLNLKLNSYKIYPILPHLLFYHKAMIVLVFVSYQDLRRQTEKPGFS